MACLRFIKSFCSLDPSPNARHLTGYYHFLFYCIYIITYFFSKIKKDFLDKTLFLFSHSMIGVVSFYCSFVADVFNETARTHRRIIQFFSVIIFNRLFIFIISKTNANCHIYQSFLFLARVERFELPPALLESDMLPLH